MLRETDPQTTIWELLLPEEAKRLPAELQAVDAYLDDERFIAPWRALFSTRFGRPTVPIDTLLRLLYLKHRYQLGYESLCREVADSSSWRRFCRIGQDRPVPHPTTLVKLVRRAGPEVIEELNAALVAKLAQGKLLRGRKLRVDTTVVEADIDYPTDADLLEQAVRKLGGLVRRVKGRGAASRTRFRDRGRAAGRRMKQLARTLRRRTGVAMAEVDRLTGEVARIARQSLGQVQVVARNAHRALARRPGDGRLTRLVGELDETISQTQRLLAQTDQRLAGDRVIADRLVSLSDPDARPIRKGKPRHPTQFGYSLLLAEDERGFICDHQLQQGNPPDAPQLVPSVERVVAVTGRVPGTVVGDRGFGTAANDQALAELGVRRVGLQRKGTLSPTRAALERTRAFRRLRNWRVGIEARISHLKRSFGLRRARLRRLGGARTWVGLGIFAYNLQRMTGWPPDDPAAGAPGHGSGTPFTRYREPCSRAHFQGQVVTSSNSPTGLLPFPTKEVSSLSATSRATPTRPSAHQPLPSLPA